MRRIHSFDIFDTLVARRCVEPVRVFEEMERDLHLPGFVRQRREAEAAVSQQAYTLASIYVELQRRLSWDEATREHVMAAEIEAEVANAIPVQENLDLVEDGDVLLSDMYLPPDAIRRLLDHVGLARQVGVLVSSHGKHSGSVWPSLRERLDPEQHAGDNAHADVASATAGGLFGWNSGSTHLSPHEQFFRANGLEQLVRAVREMRLRGSSAGAGHEALERRLLQVNCNIPLLLLTAVHLKHLARETGARRILFSSRDCLYLWRIFQRLSGELHWDIGSEYFFTSRMARRKASEDYLRYFDGLTREPCLVVDLAGTGESLAQLYERAGRAPPTFFVHDVQAMYAKPDKPASAARRKMHVLSLSADTQLSNAVLEVANAVPSGMVKDVVLVPGTEGVVPVLEHPSYPAGVRRLIDEIAATQSEFLRVLDAHDLGRLVNEVSASAIPALVAELYRSLVSSSGVLKHLGEYHGMQNTRTEWRLQALASLPRDFMSGGRDHPPSQDREPI